MNQPALPPGPSQYLAMLCRWPEMGRSKTRLAAEIGVTAAHRVYRELLHCCVRHARTACTLPHRRALFFVDPPSRCRAMAEWLGDPASVAPQGDGDLGRRMRDAAAEAFRRGAEAVALVGSDCPLLTPARIERAFAELASHRVVLGPAADGGFYLLGLSQMVPELFRPLQWGSKRVYALMRNRCRRLGVEVAELEVLPDVDRLSDLTDEVLSLLRVSRAELLPQAQL